MAQQVAQFMRDFNVDFPVLMNGVNTYRDYSQPWMLTSPFPLDYVIDADGRVAYLGTEYEPDRITAVIDSLLGEVAVADDSPWDPGRPDQGDDGSTTTGGGVDVYPNPFGGPSQFGGRTRIRFLQERPGPLWVEVFSGSGRRVATLAGGESAAAGQREFAWDGRDDAGRRLGNGYYFVLVRGGGRASNAKILLLR